MSFREWKGARVRAIQWGPKPLRPYHVTITPHFAASVPWFGHARIRVGTMHGIQLVVWRRDRWVLKKQVLGRSRVRGGK